jgi:hypothetical protein
MTAEVENFEFEDTAQVVETVAPVATAELPDIKLFGRWSCDDVQVSDMSLQVSKRNKWVQNILDLIF